VKRVATELELDASPARVYAVLADLPRYAEWNPVVKRIRGDARVGATVRFRIEIDGLPGLDLAARVCLADPSVGFGWRGGAAGVFTGEHTMRITDLGHGRTRLAHGEEFHGLLAQIALTRGTLAKIERSYAQMNAALAGRVAAS
jgi:hypothetical protein